MAGTPNVVVGRRAEAAKVERARALRRGMTAAERTLWLRLKAGQLRGLRFRRQQVIAGFIADFYCHAAGLVVEVDGAAHWGQGAYDEERDAVLAGLGLRIVRVTNDDVQYRLQWVLDQIVQAVTSSARA